MFATRSDRGMTIVLPLALGLVPALAAPGQNDEPGALEKDSKGWMDMLATAGPELDGWTRKPVPPDGELNPKSQWSLDPANGTLICQGDGGHEWLRLDQVLTDYVFHVEWRFTPVPGKAVHAGSGQEGLQLRRLRPQFVRRQDVASGPVRRRLRRVPFGETLSRWHHSPEHGSRSGEDQLQPQLLQDTLKPLE